MHNLARSILVGASALAFSATFAAAEVVCNEEGDCWRVRETHTYRPELRLQVHPDNWKWEERESTRYRWRDAGERRGYWRQGTWVDIND